MNTHLKDMFDELDRAPAIYQPSPFWRELTAVGIHQLERAGMQNFKRSLNMTYFNWNVVGILHHQLLPILRQWMRHPSAAVLRARMPNARTTEAHNSRRLRISNYRWPIKEVASLNAPSAALYRTYVAMLADFVERIDHQRLLATIEEPEFGNPFAVIHRGRRLSQDLCNSIHEFYSATSDSGEGEIREVAELGPGYGRLAFVFLEAMPQVSYTLIDIPPALYVAEDYLTRLYPSVPTFRFRPFNDFAAVRDEFLGSRIRFVEPHQIELLPDESFDLVINVSSLHEMTAAQVEHYLKQIARLGRKNFYTKQWRRSQAKVNDVVLDEYSYPLPSHWKTRYHRPHPIQSLFFEALYDVSDRPTVASPSRFTAT